MTHWLVRYTRLGWEPPRPFGKTKTIVCAATRNEAKTKVRAAPCYKITASKTDAAVSFDQRCSCSDDCVSPETCSTCHVCQKRSPCPDHPLVGGVLP